MAILTGLWSGEVVEHHGDVYDMAPTVFAPCPVQQPRIPIWVGGYWPNKPPFRRAARWDGFFPGRLTLERRAKWTPTMIPPESIAEMVEYVARHRTSFEPFDVAVPGYTGISGTGDADVVATYEKAGATWWIENIHGFRGEFAAIRARIREGPPV